MIASGVVSNVTTKSLSVAFDGQHDMLLELDNSAYYKLVKLANDVTYRRLLRSGRLFVQYIVFRRHRWTVISPIAWSVCHVCTSICAQMAQDIHTTSFAYDSPLPLPNRVKIWLTLVNPFHLKFCTKVTHPLLVWASQIAAEWLVIDSTMVAMVAMESLYRKPPSLFWMVPHWPLWCIFWDTVYINQYNGS